MSNQINKLIEVMGTAMEMKLKNFKALLIDEIRTIVRQELNDALNSGGSSNRIKQQKVPDNAKPLKDGGGNGDYDIDAIKQKLTEAQNIGQRIDNNPEVYYDDDGNAQDLSKVNNESVQKVKNNVKRDYSELIN